MKVLKILGIVFGALFLLTGIGLLTGSAVVGAGQNEFDERLAQQGLAGPVQGRVTAVEEVSGGGQFYTVSYTDKQGNPQTGAGPVGDGTAAPAQGDEVDVYYSTLDPTQIIILDFPGSNFAGVARVLRTAGIVCAVVGAILLLAGILSLVTGRKRAAVPAANPGQLPPGQDPGYAAPPAADRGPDVDPTPTQSVPPLPPPGPAPTQPPATPPDSNRPG